MLASVPLFVEYEAVLMRAEHRAAAGFGEREVVIFPDGLAALSRATSCGARNCGMRMTIWFWRPQSTDEPMRS